MVDVWYVGHYPAVGDTKARLTSRSLIGGSSCKGISRDVDFGSMHDFVSPGSALVPLSGALPP